MRVSKTSSNGREIQLYGVEPGQGCILSAQLLVRRGPVVQSTHQKLADELGGVREMVSWLLRSFEERGWVRLERERVSVLDSKSLSGLLPDPV